MMETRLRAVAHVDVVGEAGWLAAGKLTAGEASRDGEAGLRGSRLC